MSILAMLVSANPLTTITGVLGLILPPYSALQGEASSFLSIQIYFSGSTANNFEEQKITDCKAMRESNEVMQHELENLERENDRLEKQTKQLQGSVDR